MDEETNPNTIGNAFYLTLSEAARRVGRNKGSLSKAIAAGRLSALRCPETNSFKIDPAELHRYAETLQVVRTNAVSHSAGQRNETRDLPPATPVTELLEARIADLKTMLDELKADRDRQILGSACRSRPGYGRGGEGLPVSAPPIPPRPRSFVSVARRRPRKGFLEMTAEATTRG